MPPCSNVCGAMQVGAQVQTANRPLSLSRNTKGRTQQRPQTIPMERLGIGGSGESSTLATPHQLKYFPVPDEATGPLEPTKLLLQDDSK